MIIKKCISLFIATLLLASNIGIAVNVHFCNDVVASISSVYYGSNETSESNFEKVRCAANEKISQKKCCSDTQVTLKNSGENVLIKAFAAQFSTYIIPTILSVQDPNHFNETLPQEQFYCFEDHSPPLFKLYSQYILYA